MSFWSVAQVYAQRESSAAMHLKQRGFETYLPVTKQEARVCPLFPSYLFIRIELAWYDILSSPGIIRLLRNGDSPCEVPEMVLTKIHRQTDHRGLVRLPKRRGLEPGDRVRMTGGPFRDHIGIYDGMRGSERSRVLLELLGRKATIECARGDFTPLPVAQ